MELGGQEARAARTVAGYRPPNQAGPSLGLWAADGRSLGEGEEVAPALWQQALRYRLLIYQGHLPLAVHCPGTRHTQRLERKPLLLRTRLKRLLRQTLGFSKAIMRHDLVLGLFLNRYEVGLPG